MPTMPTITELSERFKTKNSEELSAMLLRPDDWTDDALSAAKAELERRELYPTAGDTFSSKATSPAMKNNSSNPVKQEVKQKDKKELEGIGCFYIGIFIISILICTTVGDLIHLGSSPRSRILFGLSFAMIAVLAHYITNRIRKGPSLLTWDSFKTWPLFLLSPVWIALGVFAFMHNGIVEKTGPYTFVTSLPPPVTVIIVLGSLFLLGFGIKCLGITIVFVLFTFDNLICRRNSDK